MPIICLITAMKCGEIHMRTRYNRYICYRKKPITIYVNTKGTCHKQDIISYFKTVCVYDMIDLNSMVFMFKLTTICSQIIYVKLL